MTNPAVETPLKVVQIAYHVKDIRAAAIDMHERFGAGPFFVSENILLKEAEHRGQATDFIHSSAYGQWGDIMVELVRQEDGEQRTPFRDMYTAEQQGLHHTAIFVDEVSTAIQQFADKGFPLATRCVTKNGEVEFAFIDATQTLGHMIEIYVPTPPLQSFYDLVKSASIDWDGKDLLR